MEFQVDQMQGFEVTVKIKSTGSKSNQIVERRRMNVSVDVNHPEIEQSSIFDEQIVKRQRPKSALHNKPRSRKKRPKSALHKVNFKVPSWAYKSNEDTTFIKTERNFNELKNKNYEKREILKPAIINIVPTRHK